VGGWKAHFCCSKTWGDAGGDGIPWAYCCMILWKKKEKVPKARVLISGPIQEDVKEGKKPEDKKRKIEDE